MRLLVEVQQHSSGGGTPPSDVDLEHFEKPHCCATNADSHNGAGPHRNAWSIINDTTLLLDSSGRRPTDSTPPRSHKRYAENRKHSHNSRTVQGSPSDTCGQSCTHVLYYKYLDIDWKITLKSSDIDLDEKDMKMRDPAKQLQYSFPKTRSTCQQKW